MKLEHEFSDIISPLVGVWQMYGYKFDLGV